jgi:uncharacterized protein
MKESDREFAETVKSALASTFEMAGDVAAAYLFGSRANGGAGPLSDVDLAVLLTVYDPCLSGEIKLQLYADCSRALKRNDIDIVILNQTRNLFLLDEVARNGVLLFDRDPSSRQEFEFKVIHDAIEFREHRMKIMGV